MVPVARRNLFSEKGRFAISVAGGAVSVLLILIVLALYRRISRPGQTFRGASGGEPLSVQRVAPSGAEALSQFVFLNFQDARRIFGVGELVNYGMVILKEGTEPDAAAQAIAARAPGLQVFPADAFVKAFRKEIDESFLPCFTSLLGIGFVLGAAG